VPGDNSLVQLPWLVALETLWIVGLVVWITLEKRSPTATLAWIFALAFLPAIGIPIYLLFGPRRLDRQRMRYNEALGNLSSAGGIRPPISRIPHDVMRQVRLAAGAAEAPLLAASEIAVLREGPATFGAIGAAIDEARHHIHLEFYIWDPDPIGSDLRDRLAARARAGVEIRVLIDAVGSSRLKSAFFRPLTDAGGRVAFFNPPRLRLGRTPLLNFRTHRKIVVVDGRVGFTGGYNVSARHTHPLRGLPPWRDTHLRIAGPAVAGLQAVFLENWHFTTGRPPGGAPYFPQLEAREVASWVQVVASGPDRDVHPIHELFVSAISAADERVWIVNPYVVPDEALATALRTAAHRGVDVRLIVPRRGDSRFVEAAMRSFFDELTAQGIRIYEFLPGMHHGKTLVVDDELAVVGTANLDNRSFRLNFEVVVAMHGADAAALLAADFELDLDDCREVAPGRDRRIGWPRRLAESGARLFAPVL